MPYILTIEGDGQCRIVLPYPDNHVEFKGHYTLQGPEAATIVLSDGFGSSEVHYIRGTLLMTSPRDTNQLRFEKVGYSGTNQQ